MIEVLTGLGWNNFFTCPDCGGQGNKRSWSNDKYLGYEVVTRDKFNTFRILFNNRVISGPWIAGVLTIKLQEQEIYAAI